MVHLRQKVQLQRVLLAALTWLSSGAGVSVAQAQVPVRPILDELALDDGYEEFKRDLDLALAEAEAAQKKKPLVAALAPAARAGIAFGEVSLGKLPVDDKGELFSEIVIAPDNMRYAYVEKVASGERVVVNGFLNDTFDKIAGGGLSGPALTFSKNGGRMAYLGIRGDRTYPVVDGVMSRPLGGNKALYLIFSPDGERLAATAQIEGKQYNVIDGKPTLSYNETGFVRFSPDSKRWMYWAKKDGREMVVVDGVPGKAYSSITNIVWSPDSRHYAYEAKDLGQSHVVLDGIEGRQYREIGGSITLFNPIVFSSTGILVYAAQNEAGPLIVLDGVEKGPLPEVGVLAWSPDGKRIAIGLGAPQRYIMVVDSFGKQDAGAPTNPEPKPYPFVSHSTVRFSPDSRRVAFVATLKRGQQLTAFDNAPDTEAVILDGVEQLSYPAPDNLMVSEFHNEIVFSPDSRRVAFLSRGADKTQKVVVDGRTGRAYDRVGFTLMSSTISFSPDSRHVAYLAEHGGKSYMVVDGQESAAYDGFVSTSQIAWHTSERPSILGHRSGMVYRVAAMITP